MLGYHCSCCYSNKRHPRLLSVTKTLTAFYLTKKVLVKKDVKCEHAQRDFAISDAATESFRNKTTIFIESFSEYLNQAKTLIHSGIKPNDCIVSFWANYSCQKSLDGVLFPVYFRSLDLCTHYNGWCYPQPIALWRTDLFRTSPRGAKMLIIFEKYHFFYI